MDNLPVRHRESSGATWVRCDHEPTKGNGQKCSFCCLELTKRPLLAPVLASGPQGGNNMVYPAIGLTYLLLLLDEALMRGGITRGSSFFLPCEPPSFVILPAVVSCPWLLSACASVMLLEEKGAAELSWHQ